VRFRAGSKNPRWAVVHRGFACGVAVLAVSLFAAGPPRARAAVEPPVTIDGPNTEGMNLEGIAMAPDGTGGLVYTKTVDGVPHVFVSRYQGSSWSAPIRADQESPFDAGQARIAAANGGRLMVVWVTQTGTVAGKIQRGIYSATLGAGAGSFSEPLLVDPNVRGGGGVDPSLAGTTPGKAIVAYRVVTYSFQGLVEGSSNAVQLRPGDVMAEIRVARLEGDHWSRLGEINRFPAASMRPPTEANAPKVAIGATGRAAVAWQEPDDSGVARIWMRRVTGGTLGPVLEASPSSWEGRPVGGDATAAALAVTPLDQVRVAALVEGEPGSSSGGRIFLSTLGTSTSTVGAKPGPPALVGAGSSLPGPSSLPALAASEQGGAEGAMRLAFVAGGALRLQGVDAQGHLGALESPPGPPAAAEPDVATSLDPLGGGVTAYEAIAPDGLPAVAVRQELPDGGAQTGLIFGPLGGDVSQLCGAGSTGGDALFAFRAGESGEFAIVAQRASAPPGSFGVEVPKKWVRPGAARVSWSPAASAQGGVTYGLLLDGRVVRSGMTTRSAVPSRSVLGDGLHRLQVIATDSLGQVTLSSAAKLRIDSQPPRLTWRVRSRKGTVSLRLRDGKSGLVPGASRISFGDGDHARRGARFVHRYEHGGRYTIRVQARDRAGNRLARRVAVVVE
jgi:hypothetical protein